MSLKVSWFCALFAVIFVFSQAQDHCKNGDLIPHQTDCSRFYLCNSNKHEELQCPNPLEFNPTLKVCDWPEDAGCTLGKSPSRNETVPESDRPCDTYPDPECPEWDPTAPVIHHPHPEDCRKFYKCDWNGPAEHDCQEGLHFSVANEYCDYPPRANCSCDNQILLNQ